MGNARDIHGATPGILLVNLGTPDAPSAPALRRYLAEFLSDPDVVTLPRLLWLPLLYLIVLRTRPAKSAEAYARVWTKEGSPLLVNSRALASLLREALHRKLGRAVPLSLGMRYGNPSIGNALAELRDAGANRLVVLPLYPQHAAATTASTFKAVHKALQRMGWAPEVEQIFSYHNHPPYIDALAASVRDFWAARGRGAKLIVSFHGIPKQVSDAGDPYAGQCALTAQALADRLDLDAADWQLGFQSRFGPAEWLKPYTDEVLRRCAEAGDKRVDVICPGFPADCLETLEEIALRYAEGFHRAGGEELRYVPALNSRADHAGALAALLLPRLGHEA